jgi:hypothetical protein
MQLTAYSTIPETVKFVHFVIEQIVGRAGDTSR